MKDSQVIYDFVSLAIESGGWMLLDRIYLQNKIADLIGCKEPFDTKNQISHLTTEELCQKLIKIAQSNKPKQYQTLEQIEWLKQCLMDILTPPPSVVNALFAKKFESSPVEATNYFYWLNQMSGYLSGESMECDDDCCECSLCFNHEGHFQYSSPFLKKTRRFIRLNLNNYSWGYQLNPLSKDKEIGLFFQEHHGELMMNQHLMNCMVNLIDLYSHYELFFSSNNQLNGHGYLTGKRPNKNITVDCHKTLPFFKDSLFAIDTLALKELVIKTPRGNDLWLIVSYVFALTAGIKREIYSSDFEYYLTKIDKEYQLVVKLKDHAREKSEENWMRTMELLSNELEVRY